MKKMKLMLMAGLLATTLLGCSTKDESKIANERIVKTDLKNVNAVFYLKQSSNYAVEFTLVSNKMLTKEEISFSSDMKLSIPFSIIEEKDANHAYYDFLVSKKLDWKKIAADQNSNDVKRIEEATKQLDSFQDEYAKSDMDMKGYHTYKVTLNFPGNELPSDQDFILKQLKMKINEEEYVLDLGKISFLKEDKKVDMDTITELNFGVVGATEYPSENKYSMFNLSGNDEWQLETQQDIVIESITPLVENTRLDGLKIIVKDNANQVSEKSYTKDVIKLPIKKGSKLTISSEFTVDDGRNDIIYHRSYNYKIKYTVNGKEQYRIIETGIVNTTTTGYGILHEEDLKKEYQSYYYDYATKVLK